MLRWFSRHGLLERDESREMLAWASSGFSLGASVCIAGQDRAGLGRLLRYCARPPFALERIEQVPTRDGEQRVVYRLPKLQRDGRTALSLTPLEFIDHLAALIPLPRRHRHRYHGVLAPNAPLRLAATAPDRFAPPASAPSSRSPARYLWALLLARLFESLPLVCPNCGADMRMVAFIAEAAPVVRILLHIGEPARPPLITPARGPPAWDEGIEPLPDWDAMAQPEPEYQFNQTIDW